MTLLVIVQEVRGLESAYDMVLLALLDGFTSTSCENGYMLLLYYFKKRVIIRAFSSSFLNVS